MKCLVLFPELFICRHGGAERGTSWHDHGIAVLRASLRPFSFSVNPARSIEFSMHHASRKLHGRTLSMAPIYHAHGSRPSSAALRLPGKNLAIVNMAPTACSSIMRARVWMVPNNLYRTSTKKRNASSPHSAVISALWHAFLHENSTCNLGM
jgi:hypothetical protein